MYIHDSHIHTEFSHDTSNDGRANFDLTVRTAIERGIDEISICDHCDIDDILDGIYPAFPADDIQNAVMTARERYAGKIRINFGVELGQPHVRPREARELIEKYRFDFVIGSLHNLRLCPDFRFFRFELMKQPQIDYIVRRIVSESCEIAEFGVTSIGHLDYVRRKLQDRGVAVDMSRYNDDFARLFEVMLKTGTALEVNTSGLEKYGSLCPSLELCALYRELGGELITFGSDAHAAKEVGGVIEAAAADMRRLGFKSQTVVRDGALTQIEL